MQYDYREPVFRETQRFRQLWLRIVVWTPPLLLGAIFGYGLYRQAVLGKPFGDGSTSTKSLALLAGLLVGSTLLFGPLLFHFIRLITEVRDDGLYVRFKPFHLGAKRIDLKTVRSVEAVTYSPLSDYGGWGIHWGSGGKAYNVSGKRGVRLDFFGGKHLLIGSQRAEELEAAIRSIMPADTPGGDS